MTEEAKEKKRLYLKEWYSRNKSYALAKAKEYREKNREKIQARQSSDEGRSYQRSYYKANPDKIKQYKESWRNGKGKGYDKKYREANKDKIQAYDAAWKRANRKQVSAYEKKRKVEDLNFSIKKRLRSRVWHSVNRQSGKKAKSTMALLGCSIASFRIYIESKFQPGMTWENIHLDHIVPCALFDLTKPEHQKICFHFSNYQPLLAIDNIRKGARVYYRL